MYTNPLTNTDDAPHTLITSQVQTGTNRYIQVQTDNINHDNIKVSHPVTVTTLILQPHYLPVCVAVVVMMPRY